METLDFRIEKYFSFDIISLYTLLHLTKMRKYDKKSINYKWEKTKKNDFPTEMNVQHLHLFNKPF